MNLSDNQQECFDKLSRLKVGALFMEAGTGKTLAASMLIESITDVDYILWLTPFQTKANLRAELDKWSILEPDIIDIVGIETLSSSDRTYLSLIDKLQSSRKSVIVCDESLKIKNITAKRTRRIIELANRSEYRLLLNGTPVSKNISDIWAQFEFLSHRILNMTSTQYINTFCKYTDFIKRSGSRTEKNRVITGYENVDYLYSLIGHYIYECNLSINVKSEYKTITFSVDDDCREEYNRIKAYFLEYETLMKFDNNIFMRMTQALQQSYSRSTSKIDSIKDIVDKDTIIFCKYIATMDMISTKFPQARVLSYGKHTFGLNLQEYNKCIFFDKTFDYAFRIQAERRIYRTGQERDCTYYDLTSDIGLDKIINQSIYKKKSLLDYFKQKGREIFKEL